MLKIRGGEVPTALQCAGWLALLSYFATPHGMATVWFCTRFCSADASLAWAAAHPLQTALISSAIMSAVSVATFVPFARYFDQLYASFPGMRCQTQRTMPLE